MAKIARGQKFGDGERLPGVRQQETPFTSAARSAAERDQAVAQAARSLAGLFDALTRLVDQVREEDAK